MIEVDSRQVGDLHAFCVVKERAVVGYSTPPWLNGWQRASR